MTEEHQAGPRELAAIITQYLLAEERGEVPDRDAVLRDHPEHAADLQSFFASHDRLEAACQGQWSTLGLGSGTRRDEGATLPDDRWFGDYELLEEIDRGGMGVVYRARQVSLNRIVALKLIKSGFLATAAEVDRFKTEARAAAALQHAGIVTVYEVGEAQGLPYFTMAYVDGQSLAQRLLDGPLDSAEAALLLREVTDAVAYAHSRGVIHRDLKPGNILLDQRGVPHITDFGLAKNLLAADEGGTQSGQLLGTPAYMSPEQARGQKDQVGPLTDVYSLGAVLYALCTGRPPHAGHSPVDVLLGVLENEPTLPTRLAPHLPRALESICMKCLEKRPAERYESAAALSAELERFLRDEPIEARKRNPWHSLRRNARRAPALAAHLGGIVSMSGVTVANYFTFPTARFDYLVFYLAVFALWFASSCLLQLVMCRPAWSSWARFAWATVDMACLSAILYVGSPPAPAMLVGYPLLIVASGMFLQTTLTAYTTTGSVLSYLLLVTLAPDWFGRLYPAYAAGLVIIGVLVSLQVQRLNALSRYYERV